MISFLVTCHTETETLKKLLFGLVAHVLSDQNGEIVVLRDVVDAPDTKAIVEGYLQEYPEIIGCYDHFLNNDYGAHKNVGSTLCKGDYIFQIDGDERPEPELLLNFEEIIKSNPNTEVFWVPRINDFRGVTEEHAKRFGWRLTESKTYKRPIVNWPDWQARLYKNRPHIKWNRKLHETLAGHNSYGLFPEMEELALYHDKTIETQLKTNERYNKDFSEDDNRGHHLWKDSSAEHNELGS